MSNLEIQIDNQGFYIFKLEIEESCNENKEMLKERVLNSKKVMETHLTRKHELEKQQKSRENKLNAIVLGIKESTLSPSNKSYFLNMIKQQ